MKAAMLAHDLLVAGSAEIDRRRRHGEHDQRALPAAEGARRLPHGPRRRCIDHMFLDGLEDAYDKGRLMGDVRRGLRRASTHFTREAQDALRARLAARARRPPTATARSPGRSRRSTVAGRKGERVVDNDEQPVKADARQDPDAEARVPQGRHGDRRQLELDLRRRRGAGADAPLDGGDARLAAARRRSSATRRTRRSPAGSPPRRSARSRSCYGRPAGRRSDVDLYEINEAFAVVDDGRDEGARPAARQGQRARRRLRARPSDRRLGRAHRRHAARRAAQARAASAASRRCASAAARRPRWRSSWCDDAMIPLASLALFVVASVPWSRRRGRTCSTWSRARWPGTRGGLRLARRHVERVLRPRRSPRRSACPRCSPPCRSPTTVIRRRRRGLPRVAARGPHGAGRTARRAARPAARFRRGGCIATGFMTAS